MLTVDSGDVVGHALPSTPRPPEGTSTNVVYTSSDCQDPKPPPRNFSTRHDRRSEEKLPPSARCFIVDLLKLLGWRGRRPTLSPRAGWCNNPAHSLTYFSARSPLAFVRGRSHPKEQSLIRSSVGNLSRARYGSRPCFGRFPYNPPRPTFSTVCMCCRRVAPFQPPSFGIFFLPFFPFHGRNHPPVVAERLPNRGSYRAV